MASEFEFYRDLNNNTQNIPQEKSSTLKSYNDSLSNSLASDEVQHTSKKNVEQSKVKPSLKQSLTAIAGVAIVAVSVWAGTAFANEANHKKDEKRVDSYFAQQGVTQVLKDAEWEKWYPEHTSGYNQHKLADYSEEQNNIDLAIYGMYRGFEDKNLDEETIKYNMDGIISRIEWPDGSKYDNADQYYAARGFVSAKEYSEVMFDRSLAQAQIEDVNAKHGIGK